MHACLWASCSATRRRVAERLGHMGTNRNIAPRPLSNAASNFVESVLIPTKNLIGTIFSPATKSRIPSPSEQRILIEYPTNLRNNFYERSQDS